MFSAYCTQFPIPSRRPHSPSEKVNPSFTLANPRYVATNAGLYRY